MFNKLITFGKFYNDYMTRRGRIEAHKILTTFSDRTLEDIGISRTELNGGLKYWPWDGSVTAKHNAATLSEQQSAVNELNNYSDRELHDLGINRGMIADAVANGRPGIDDVKTVSHTATENDLRAA